MGARTEVLESASSVALTLPGSRARSRADVGQWHLKDVRRFESCAVKWRTRRDSSLSASRLTRMPCRSRAVGICVSTCMNSCFPHRSQRWLVHLLLRRKDHSMSDELIRLPDAMEPVTRPGIIHHRSEHPGCAKNAGWALPMSSVPGRSIQDHRA